MNKSESINDLASALAKFQAGLKTVKTDSTNPHFKNKFASLAAIFDAIRAPLAACDMSVSQVCDDQGLVTILMHTSGQWIASRMPIMSRKADDPQAYGSGLSYAKRYSLSAILGVAIEEEDDDGERAAKKPTGQTSSRPSTPPNTTPYPPKQDPSWVDEPSEQSGSPDMATDKQIKKLHVVGKQFYGDEWDARRKALIQWATNEQSESTSDLTKSKCSELIDGIVKKMEGAK